MSLTNKHACENYGRHNVQRVPEVHRRWEGTWKYCKSQVSSSNLQSTKKMASKELGCVGGNPMHKEGAWPCWRRTMNLWNWKSEMDELQRAAGMTRSCEELCDPSPCCKQLSPTLFVLQENMGVLFYLFIYNGLFFQWQLQDYDHTHSFYFSFQNVCCGGFLQLS
jgi:hypothetical protein